MFFQMDRQSVVPVSSIKSVGDQRRERIGFGLKGRTSRQGNLWTLRLMGLTGHSTDYCRRICILEEIGRGDVDFEIKRLEL